jgi:hypothetical protein
VPTAGDIGGGSISFGLQLSAKPSVVVMAPGAGPTASCPGSLTSPEEAPGVLCVYKSVESNTPGIVVCDQDCDEGEVERYGAALFVQAAAGGRVFSDGSWAVTAP